MCDLEHNRNIKSSNVLISSGRDCWQWSCREVFNDPEILQRNFHRGIQEDNWSGLSGEKDLVMDHN